VEVALGRWRLLGPLNSGQDGSECAYLLPAGIGHQGGIGPELSVFHPAQRRQIGVQRGDPAGLLVRQRPVGYRALSLVLEFWRNFIGLRGKVWREEIRDLLSPYSGEQLDAVTQIRHTTQDTPPADIKANAHWILFPDSYF